MVAVIPSRMASTRFPGKPLADAKPARPMVQHVYEQCRHPRLTRSIASIVATDDRRSSSRRSRRFGGEAVMTSPDHPNGTSRIAEVAESAIPCSIVVNVQGDEPMIDPEAIDLAVDQNAAGGRSRTLRWRLWPARSPRTRTPTTRISSRPCVKQGRPSPRPSREKAISTRPDFGDIPEGNPAASPRRSLRLRTRLSPALRER